MPIPADGPIVLRVERKGDQVRASFSVDGEELHSLHPRTVRFPAKLKLGVAAISSSGDTFTVTLANFRVLRPE
jgi:regulation of enolase protein 1 (concanavalin A-like superfamily)